MKAFQINSRVAVLALSVTCALVAFDPAPQFDVASIKPSAPGTRDGMAIQPNGRFMAANAPLKLLISIAYNVGPFEMSSGEPWMTNERWDIEAKSDPMTGVAINGPFSIPEVVRMRLRSLLAERFALRVHRETAIQSAYALTIAKNGVKLTRADETAQPETPHSSTLRAGPGVVIGAGTPMKELIAYLLRLVDRPIIDRTGLEGRFNFKLQFAPDSTPRAQSAAQADAAAPSQASEDPSIFTALQEQLGLKLESIKEPVEMLTIDSAARPSAN